ncbi:hemerythrin domain-containing protein [Bailinhaonella thermotolerans]|uniref:Hemerythrin domain-containing protein n=1 Tax=Bailinhaonella thermotolerans TaxID=1070861 RepID=A0A3A4ASI7_9ACTN|nr:hemerythrin domain-containing protein [Bailinhaonella thermotolerans]RJL32191.1 hemerythrin domain-containing protein [Bailinhaonella thermotolerans]
MSEVTPSREAHADSPLMAELLWVHDWIRRDLRRCQELARAVRAGAAADQVRAEVRELRTAGPLWRLRAGCLRYCALVHHHHRLEDAHMFPALRRYAPELATTLDRLERDHAEVSDVLDEVEAATETLAGDGGERLAAALDRLADHLLDHLDREERAVAPVFARNRLTMDDLFS